MNGFVFLSCTCHWWLQLWWMATAPTISRPDTTVLWNRYCMIHLSVVCCGRAIPLPWVLEHGSATVAFRYKPLLRKPVAAAASPNVMLLADRGLPPPWWVGYKRLVLLLLLVLRCGMGLDAIPLKLPLYPKGRILTVMSACGRMDVTCNERGCLTSRESRNQGRCDYKWAPSLQTVWQYALESRSYS